MNTNIFSEEHQFLNRGTSLLLHKLSRFLKKKFYSFTALNVGEGKVYLQEFEYLEALDLSWIRWKKVCVEKEILL